MFYAGNPMGSGGMTTPYLAGLALGLAIAAPIGPMGILCIGRTMGVGVGAGIATGLGAATIHASYGAAAAYGLGTSGLWAGTSGIVFGITSAMIMFWLAMRMLRVPQLAMPGAPPLRKAGHRVGMYASALAFGAVNPTTLLFFAAAVPTLTQFQSPHAPVWLAAGIFTGSILWWISLSFATDALRARIGPKLIALTNRASAALLTVLGTVLLAKAAAGCF